MVLQLEEHRTKIRELTRLSYSLAERQELKWGKPPKETGVKDAEVTLQGGQGKVTLWISNSRPHRKMENGVFESNEDGKVTIRDADNHGRLVPLVPHRAKFEQQTVSV